MRALVRAVETFIEGNLREKMRKRAGNIALLCVEKIL